VETGRPNACNQCHLDRSLGWTAGHLEEWYGTPRPTLSAEQDGVAASALWSLTGDAGQRALMAWSMGWEEARAASGEDWMPPYLISLLDDPYVAVRYIAPRSLRRHSGFEDFEYDHLADRLQRELDVRRALEQWARVAPPRTRRPNDATLLGADGDLLWSVFAGLRARRDDRIVELRE
jgi:hypothetical protein